MKAVHATPQEWTCEFNALEMLIAGKGRQINSIIGCAKNLIQQILHTVDRVTFIVYRHVHLAVRPVKLEFFRGS